MITLRLLYFSTIFLYFKIVSSKNPSVIIVGAGSAGIAAATKLLENSFTNITILEAENRIGGRIHSVKFGDDFVDLGAQYCHGEEGNIVFELVKDLDVLEHSNLFSSQTVRLYTSNGSLVPSELANDLFSAVMTYDENDNVTGNISLGAAFLEKYNSTILQKYKQDKEKLKLAVDGIKYLEDIVLTNEGAFSWEKPAAARHFAESKGDQVMTWKTGGYHMVLDILMKSYPNASQKLPIDDKILLNKTVSKILWGNDKITVCTSDNTELIADYVIFTPSVGVLKKFKHTIFEPQLPEAKQEALEAIGFDGVMKIVLHFPTIWWKNATGFSFLWNKEDLLGIKNEFPHGPDKDGISWVAFIPAIAKVASNNNVLTAWVSGDLVPEIEQISDDVLLRGCMYLLRRFLGKDYNITDADKIISSKWNTNPNFEGTYSYEKVGYFTEKVSYQAKLAEPLNNKEGKPALLFAGEGTHSAYYSTVHGAIASGRREAERIINLHKQ